MEARLSGTSGFLVLLTHASARVAQGHPLECYWLAWGTTCLGLITRNKCWHTWYETILSSVWQPLLIRTAVSHVGSAHIRDVAAQGVPHGVGGGPQCPLQAPAGLGLCELYRLGCHP